jgi:hypothetical protein
VPSSTELNAGRVSAGPAERPEGTQVLRYTTHSSGDRCPRLRKSRRVGLDSLMDSRNQLIDHPISELTEAANAASAFSDTPFVSTKLINHFQTPTELEFLLADLAGSRSSSTPTLCGIPCRTGPQATPSAPTSSWPHEVGHCETGWRLP